jgi:hypothetical protein
MGTAGAMKNPTGVSMSLDNICIRAYIITGTEQKEEGER